MGDAAVYDLAAVIAERDALAAEKADCEKFLKEGERLDECLERWRADALAVLELLAQEKVKSEALAAEVAQSDAEYQDAVTLAQSNKDRLDVALAEVALRKSEVELFRDKLKARCDEVAKLRAACAAKDAALSKALGYVDLDNDALISKCLAALKGTAGTNWIDATGAVERTVGIEIPTDAVPDSWAGREVIVMVKP